MDNSSLEKPKARPRPTNENLKNLEMEEFKIYKTQKGKIANWSNMAKKESIS